MNGFLTVWVAIIGMPYYIRSDCVCVGVCVCALLKTEVFSVRDLHYCIMSCFVLYGTQWIILSFCNLLCNALFCNDAELHIAEKCELLNISAQFLNLLAGVLCLQFHSPSLPRTTLGALQEALSPLTYVLEVRVL